MDWTRSNPTRLNVVSLPGDQNVATAERDVVGKAGLMVIGEADASGELNPDTLMPYLRGGVTSSDARISYEKKAGMAGYSGMCEDNRFGMALIFTVSNPQDVLRAEQDYLLKEAPFSKVALSILLSEGTVLLPLASADKVPVRKTESLKERMEDAIANDPEALERLAREELVRFEKAMKKVQETDIFSVVDNFFMPHGMESDQYYFMGVILSKKLFVNELTDEHFYRMVIDCNGVEFTIAVNQKDLEGEPTAGYRLKGRGMLMGELKE